MSFFGVFLPNEAKNSDDGDSSLVFESMADVAKLMKKHRDSRFKPFKTFEEAETFSLCGHENHSSTSSTVQAKGDSQEAPASPAKNGASSLVGEKPSSFRGPTSQDLVKFRKCIEQGKLAEIEKTIWTNPRYLISSGDTPTILKESFRYNAVHVAAINKNGKVCEIILEAVRDPQFITLLHGKDNERTAEEVSEIMLDMYLNMPEKGRSETPLHLAAKFGAVDVVRVLTSYKECQMTRNSDGMFPKEIICSRNEAAGKETVEAIKLLFDEQFYVPVIRSVDNSMPPIIGDPFSPTQSIMNIIDPKSPDMEIKAIAGPMNKDQAKTFQRRWKTPPRTLNASPFGGSPQSQNTITSPLSSLPNSVTRNRFTPVKTNSPAAEGHKSPFLSSEKLPRRLFDATPNIIENHSTEPDEFVAPMKHGTIVKSLFSKYRDNLDDSVSSVLNNSLNDSVMDTPGYKERNLKLADVEKGHEVIGRCLAKDNNIGWKEHWSFLDEFLDMNTIYGLEKFESYLKQKLSDKLRPPPALPLHQLTERLTAAVESSPMSAICRGLNKIHVSRDSFGMKLNLNEVVAEQQIPFTPVNSPNAFHSYLCVEKSCQVFAKRLMKPLLTNPNNLVTVCDALSGELSRLKSLVCSYKEDPLFCSIDFRVTHSRFAHIIAVMLKENDANQNNTEQIDEIRDCLERIFQAKEKSKLKQITQNINNNGPADALSSPNQLICLIKFLLVRLGELDRLVSPETLTTERDCVDVWASEELCDCPWVNPNNKGHRSIKRRSGNEQKLIDLEKHATEVQTSLTIDDMSDAMDDFRSLSHSEDSDSDADDQEFFTPPETPSNMFFDSCDKPFNFTNFIYGEEPTKTDEDVFKALNDAEIDRNSFPCVYDWFSALHSYSLEERSSFPPFQSAHRASAGANDKNNKKKRLFPTPAKDISNNVSKFQLKPSILSRQF